MSDTRNHTTRDQLADLLAPAHAHAREAEERLRHVETAVGMSVEAEAAVAATHALLAIFHTLHPAPASNQEAPHV